MCEKDLIHVHNTESLQEPIDLAFDDSSGEHDFIDLFDQDSSFRCKFVEHDGDIERVRKHNFSLFDDNIH